MTEETAPQEADELAAIEALYQAGDAKEVNRRASALAESAKDDKVRERAKQLQGRVQLDPFVLWVWIGTVVFVAAIVYFYVLK